MKYLPLILLVAAVGCSSESSSSTSTLDPGVGGKPGVNDTVPPLAVSLVADTPSVPLGKALTFTATASATNGAVVYLWDFGDESFSSTALNSTAHAYSRIGQFTASVQARDSTQARGTASITVGVTDPIPNTPPPPVPPPSVLAVRMQCAISVRTVNCTVLPTLNGVGAGDQIRSVAWSWGDGSSEQTQGASAGHTYAVGPLQARSITGTVTMTTGETSSGTQVIPL